MGHGQMDPPMTTERSGIDQPIALDLSWADQASVTFPFDASTPLFTRMVSVSISHRCHLRWPILGSKSTVSFSLSRRQCNIHPVLPTRLVVKEEEQKEARKGSLVTRP
jgi:hypothetical protein